MTLWFQEIAEMSPTACSLLAWAIVVLTLRHPTCTVTRDLHVTNLTFVVNNWQTVTVRWDLEGDPDVNGINVSVIWTAAGARYWYTCSKSTLRSCFLDERDYSDSSKYIFNITVSTQDGETVHINASMNPSDYVIPAPLKSLHVGEVTSRCVELLWQYRDLGRDVNFNVTYSDSTSTNTGITSHYNMTVCGLTPYTRYNFSVSAMSATARDGYRSKPRTVSSVTEEEKPGAAPNMTVGSFTTHTCSNNKRDVTVYLRPPNRPSHNGVLRRYLATSAPRFYRNISYPAQTLLLEDLNCNDDYSVFVCVTNDAGVSPPFSLRIPKLGDVVPPLNVLVAFDNTSVKVSWESASQRGKKNWTVFWNVSCVRNPDDQPCQNHMDWINLETNESFVKFPFEMPPEVIQFGVAMTTDGGNSGMVLSSCVYNVSKIPTEPPPVLSVESQPNLGLTVKWSLETCYNDMLITQYNIQHCYNRDFTTCESASVSSENNSYVIRGLQKDVQYRVRIRQRTAAGLYGVFSEPVDRLAVDTRLTILEIFGITIGCLIYVMGLGYTIVQCIRHTCQRWNRNEEIILPRFYSITGVQEASASTSMNTYDTVQRTLGTEGPRASHFLSILDSCLDTKPQKNAKADRSAQLSAKSLREDYAMVGMKDDSMPGNSVSLLQLSDVGVWGDSSGSSDEDVTPYVTAGRE
ncbi:receptor-type tyrosine-protein phosphatase F-like [Haliotis asinina]|uniref:receptor-type tyrosine-protein phosphatase F-like n=1 Tax=Haliotis asinina TaxID=109174 RepID=UPI0035321A9C